MIEVRRTAEFMEWIDELRDAQARARIAPHRTTMVTPSRLTTGGRTTGYLRPWIPDLLRPAWWCRDDPVVWRRQGIAVTGHRAGEAYGKGGRNMAIGTKPCDGA
jgi:hypothetical protein